MAGSSRVSGWWYLLALVPVAIGVALAVVGVFRMIDEIEAMQRVVVPGEDDLELAAGDYVVYGETESQVSGTYYRNTSIALRCAITGPDGQQITLDTPTGTTKYTMGGYSGQSMFEFEAPSAGTYHLQCTGDGSPAVLAIGTGIGTGIVLIVVSALVGFIAALVVFFVVRRKRKRAAA